LTISPREPEAKITFWDGGNALHHYGIGVSNAQLNIHSGLSADIVYYNGGRNGPDGNSTELMRIRSNGNVGIGVNPTSKLHVDGNSTIIGKTLCDYLQISCKSRVLNFDEGTATRSSEYPLLIESNGIAADTNLNICALAFGVASTLVSPGGVINFVRTGINGFGYLSFRLRENSNGTAALTEVMRLSHNNISFFKNIEFSSLKIAPTELNSQKLILYSLPQYTNTNFEIGVKQRNNVDPDNLSMDFNILGLKHSYRWMRQSSACMMELKSVNLDVGTYYGLGIGTTNGPTYQLHLTTYSAYKPGGGEWLAGCDERIKENIESANIDLCYENIKKLPLKRFTWKTDVFKDYEINDRNVLGWIAQDVEKIFPKAVTTNENHGISDFKTLNTSEINKALYGCVHKLIQKVEALESTNDLLLNRLNSLETEINNLKNNI
jgi:hypothetical protein